MFGCLRRFILVIIIVVGVGYYVFDTYGNDIYNSFKISVIDYLFNDSDVSNLSTGDESDKLKILINDYFDHLKDLDFSDAYDKSRSFFKEIENFIDDHKLTEKEINKLKEYIKNE